MNTMADKKSGVNLLGKRAEDEGKPKHLPRTFRILFTISLYSTFIAFGICRGLYGPTLGELQELTQQTLPRVSAIFTWLGIGGILGSLTYGYLFDRFQALPLLIVSCMCWGGLTSAIPWCTRLPLMMAVCAGQSFIFTGLAVGCNVVILRLWRSRSSPFLLGLHVLFTCGCVLAPLIAEPFLSEHTERTGTSSFMRRIENNRTSLPFLPCSGSKTNTTDYEMIFNISDNGLLHEYDDSKGCFVELSSPKSVIYKAYAITGGYIVLIGIFNLIFYICYRNYQLESPDEKQANIPVIRNLQWLKYTSWGLFMLFTMCFGGVENIYMGFLYTFANSHIGMDTSDSAELAAGTFAAFAVGRLLSLFFTKCLQIRVIISLYLSCAVVGSVALACQTHPSVIGIWICVVMVYLGIAPLFGSCLVWAGDYIPVSGKFTSTYVVGYTTGMMTWPLLTGYLIENSGGAWFTYIATGLLGGCVIVVVLLWTIRLTMLTKPVVTVVSLGESKLREEGVFASMRSIHTI